MVRKREDGRYELVHTAGWESGWKFPAAGPRSAADAVRDLAALASYLEDLRRSDPKGLAEAGPALASVIDRLTKISK